MKIDLKVLVFILLFCLVELFLLKDSPFFWDGVADSIRASYFFENGFGNLLIPTDINAGHPPLYPLLLAVIWEMLGKTLFASRVLTFVFSVGMYYQVYRLVTYYVDSKLLYLIFFLVAIEPTLLAQTTTLNNDIVLIFFTLWAINSILYVKNVDKYFAFTGLLLTNLKGLPILVSFLIIDWIYRRVEFKNNTIKQYFPYIFSSCIIGIFLTYRYSQLDWVLSSPSPNWIDQRQIVGFPGVVHNVLALIFDFVGLTRLVFVILFFSAIAYIYRKMKAGRDRELVGIFTIFTLVLFFPMAGYSNPICMRYFTFSFIIMTILAANFVVYSMPKSWIVILLLIIVNMAAHFVVYPDKISFPWDSSLAYLRYEGQEKKIFDYMKSNNISPKQVATNIPINNYSYAYLDRSSEKLNGFQEMDFVHKYILYSNIENTTSDEEIDKIKSMKKLIELSNLGVHISLYENTLERTIGDYKFED